jgi:acetyltransferase-like isoleucine patch superfamily enzyme
MDGDPALTTVLSRGSRLYRGLRQARNMSVILRRRLRSVHRTAYIHPRSVVAEDLHADQYAFVGPGCRIPPLVRVGKYSMLAADVAIVGDDHHWDEPGVPMQFAGRPVPRATRIGADVWLGHGVTVMRGVTVGDGSIVAAGAVVTHDIPPCEIWAGVPARKLRDRFDASQRRTHEEMLSRPHIAPSFAADPTEPVTRRG